MRIPNRWAVFAVAHLAVLSCLSAGVILIAIRLGKPVPAAKAAASPLSINAPSDTEVARLNLLATRIEVMQNNLANAETVAFKRERVFVEDGNPPKISETQLDLTQGSLESTGGSTDLAIEGDGFFHVKVRPTLADGTAYTRNGRLNRGPNGDLMVAIGGGCQLIPALNIPPGATNLSVAQDGTVTYRPEGGTRTVTAGQIHLCRFANPEALNRADGLYVETTESGPPTVGVPGDRSLGQLQQGFLESSNVDPVKEWAMIRRAQRMLQFSSVASADDLR